MQIVHFNFFFTYVRNSWKSIILNSQIAFSSKHFNKKWMSNGLCISSTRMKDLHEFSKVSQVPNFLNYVRNYKTNLC